MVARFAEPILHVDMDAFFVEVERLRRPELVGRPVVVGGTGPRSVVASASYEARQFGVRSAMPMGEARRRCRELEIVPPDHGEYGRASELVFRVFRDITPLVEGLSIDEAFLDVSGLRLHHPSPVAVGSIVRERIRDETGLPASVGIAASKFVAKLASQEAKPDGLFHVSVDRQLPFLAALPITRMWGVGPATAATLHRLGVHRIADLAGLEDVLRRELGASLADHLCRLSVGDDRRAVQPDTEAKSVSTESTFETDLAEAAAAIGTVRAHAERVGRRLRRSGLLGRTISVKIRYDDFTTISRSTTIAEPTDSGHIIGAIASELAEAALDGSRPVRLVGVAVSLLEPAGAPRQLTVLDDARNADLVESLDSIRERFGDSGVELGVVRFSNNSSQEKFESTDM